MTATSPLAHANEFVAARQDQIDHWRVVVAPGARVPTLIGNCPACLDSCEVTVAEVIVKGGGPSGATDAVPPEMTRQIICNCRIDHRPPAGIPGGCGRYWLGTLRLQPDGSYALTAETNLRLMPAAAALNEALASEGKRIQAAAERWLSAVTAIFGLFSLTGVATAKDALTGLSTGSKWWVAAALILALGLAATALLAGYRAAYGWPMTVDVSDNAKLQAWYEGYRGYGPAAARSLRTAVAFAVGALAALILVMLLVWFLPRAATS